METNAANSNAEPYDPRKYRVPVFSASIAMAFFYIFAILLNANGIQRDIELMPYGKSRDVSLFFFSPVTGFSNRLGLTKLRTMIEKSIGARIRDAKINP